MKPKNITRRARSFRRGMAAFLVLLLAVTGYTVYAGRRDRLPEVRVGEVTMGDVISYLNVTTDIQPSRIQEETVSGQRVKTVHVQKGERVTAGQLLVTFDTQPLQQAYDDAVALSEKTAAALADSTRAMQELQAATAASAAESAQQLAAVQASIEDLMQTFDEIGQTMREIEERLENPSIEWPTGTPTLPVLPTLPSFPTGLPTVPPATPTPTAAPTTTASPTTTSPTTASPTTTSTTTESTTAAEGELRVLSRAADATRNVSASMMDPSMLAALGSMGGLGTASTQLESLLNMAQGTHIQALQTEEAARLALENAVTEIRATFGGIVYALHATAGEMTPAASTGLNLGLGSTETPTVVVYDDARLLATFRVGRGEAKKLSVGMPVEFQQEGTTFTGSIRYIATIASQGSSALSGQADSLFGMGSAGAAISEPTLDVEIVLSSHRPGDVTIGFPLDARIRVAAERDVLRVPSEALRKELGTYYVFVVDNGQKLHKTPVAIGIQSDAHAQILSGLAAGERVVLNPTGSLDDGMTVREKKENP